MQHRCIKCLAANELPDGFRFNACTSCGAAQADAQLERQTQLTAQVHDAERTVKPAELPRSPASGMALASWALTLLAACVAAAYGVFSQVAATSAPQQAAGAAIACATAIIPYVFARAVDRLTQR